MMIISYFLRHCNSLLAELFKFCFYFEISSTNCFKALNGLARQYISPLFTLHWEGSHNLFF